MPNHQFKCLECGHVFEALLPAGKNEGMKCLECGHPETQKLLSAPGVQFKGGGFYKTDSQSAPSASPSPAPTPTPESPKTNE